MIDHRLPVELYRSIVVSVTDIHDLFSLSITSQSFCAEAERVLYRDIRIDLKSSKGLTISSFFHRRRHTFQHIHILRFISITASNPDSKHHHLQILTALSLVPNLKDLHLHFTTTYAPIPFLNIFPEHPSFQLEYIALHNVQLRSLPGLETVLKNQEKLTGYAYHHERRPHNTLAPSDLPGITTLSSNYYDVLFPFLYSNQPIRNLQFSGYVSDLRKHFLNTVVESIQSLALGDIVLPSDMDFLVRVFPNLRYLEGRFFDKMIPMLFIDRFNYIQKLKMLRPVHYPFTDLPQKLFGSQTTTLNTIEIQAQVPQRKEVSVFERGGSAIPRIRSENMEEWREW